MTSARRSRSGDRVAVLREGAASLRSRRRKSCGAVPATNGWHAFSACATSSTVGGRIAVVRPEAVRVLPGDEAVVLASERRGPGRAPPVRGDERRGAGGGDDGARAAAARRPCPGRDRRGRRGGRAPDDGPPRDPPPRRGARARPGRLVPRDDPASGRAARRGRLGQKPERRVGGGRLRGSRRERRRGSSTSAV